MPSSGGSEPAGMRVAEQAGKRIKKTVLELGGSDPFIVMPSADLDETARIAAQARTINNGQSCIAAKRFIVHEQVYERFTKEFVARMAALRVGDPLEATTDVGPIVSAAERDKLVEQVAAAVRAGGRVLVGGAAIPGGGCYFQPTVLEGVPRGSPAALEEIFGPVAMLFRVKDVDEAIAVANDVPFGLGSSVWTKSLERATLGCERLQSGITWVNQHTKVPPDIFGPDVDTVPNDLAVVDAAIKKFAEAA